MKIVRHRDVDVALWLYTREAPPQDEWESMVAPIAPLFDVGAETQLARFRMLVISDGGAPNTMQRAQLSKWLRGRPHKVSVITPPGPSALKRGMMTALAWINPSMAFFPPDRLGEALEHIDVPSLGPTLLAEYRTLQAQLPLVRTLVMVEQQLRRQARSEARATKRSLRSQGRD